MRSKTRAMEPVRPSTRRTSWSCSFFSRAHRSAQRAWSSRSGQSWHGWARSWARRRASWASSVAPDRARVVRPGRVPGSSSAPSALRRVEARSRRWAGTRALNVLGMRTRATVRIPPGASATVSFFTWRSCVRTVGRGPSNPAPSPGSSTTT